MGATRRSRWKELIQGSVINKVLRDSGPIDVHVISYESDDDEHATRLPLKRRLPILSTRRRTVGWVIGLVGVPLMTAVFAQLRGHITLMLLYLLLVTVVAAVGGRLPALVTAVTASLAVNWYFTPPFYTFTIHETSNLLALCVFLAVAIIVGRGPRRNRWLAWREDSWASRTRSTHC
jgi:two-component system sensor histidine kinase KdpD